MNREYTRLLEEIEKREIKHKAIAKMLGIDRGGEEDDKINCGKL